MKKTRLGPGRRIIHKLCDLQLFSGFELRMCISVCSWLSAGMRSRHSPPSPATFPSRAPISIGGKPRDEAEVIPEHTGCFHLGAGTDKVEELAPLSKGFIQSSCLVPSLGGTRHVLHPPAFRLGTNLM